MTIFQDPRASALVAKIEAIHAAGFDKPLAPVSEQSIFFGVVKDGKLCRDSFMKIFNEMVEAKAQEVQVVLADQIRENISGIKSIRNSLLFAIRN